MNLIERLFKYIIIGTLSTIVYSEELVDIANSQDRYEFSSESQTVIDKVTNLEWMRCSLGQIWSGGSCLNEPIKYKVLDAIAFAEDFSFANKSDWRVPNALEILTTVYCSDANPSLYQVPGTGSDGCDYDGHPSYPTIDLEVFPDTPNSRYWTSEKYNGGDSGKNQYWNMKYDKGWLYDYSKAVPSYVRLVRGPCYKCKD